jgi:hypothetical protein
VHLVGFCYKTSSTVLRPLCNSFLPFYTFHTLFNVLLMQKEDIRNLRNLVSVHSHILVSRSVDEPSSCSKIVAI